MYIYTSQKSGHEIFLKIAGVGNLFAFANYNISHQFSNNLISTCIHSVRDEDPNYKNEIKLDFIIKNLITNYAPYPHSATSVDYLLLSSWFYFYRKW